MALTMKWGCENIPYYLHAIVSQRPIIITETVQLLKGQKKTVSYQIAISLPLNSFISSKHVFTAGAISVPEK